MSELEFDNIANSTGNVVEGSIETKVCPDMKTLYFELEDRCHVFQIELTTILECLFFAAKEQKIPELPLEWYRDVCSRYDIPFESQYGRNEG